ncbi:MAG TPA: hypothetical protein VN948_15410 [Terriglobales bacterium]|nr:hypothetical protein [Terriglobales bacterium]
MRKRAKRKRNTKATNRLAELLADVLDSFGEYGIGMPPEEEVAIAEDAGAEAAAEEQEEYDIEPEYYFDPADVQGALDEAISAIISEKLIEEFRNPKKPPTLAEMFDVLFGRNSELRQQAEYFEELISGYEDRAHVDDLKEAHGILESILEEISPRQE